MAVTEPIVRRVKEPGVLSRTWDQAGATVINTAGVAENGTGFIKDTFVLGREAIKPSIVDAGVETLVAVAEGIQDLMKLGVNEEEARIYIGNLIK